MANAELLTRCPSCHAELPVSPEQLRVRGGEVQCGECDAFFNAHHNLIDGAAASQRAAEGPHAARHQAEAPAAAAPPPASARPRGAPATGRDVSAGGFLRAPAAPSLDLAPTAVAREQAMLGRQPEPLAAAATQDAPSDLLVRHRRREPAWRRHWRRLAPAFAILLALLLTLATAALLARTSLAGRQPALRPLLEALCAPFACEVPPWQDLSALRIDASQLQQGDEPGSYVLTLTLRNQSAARVALPEIELVLTDLQDQPVQRRVFRPADYAGAGSAARPERGVAPHGELGVQVRFRAEDARAAPATGLAPDSAALGYRVLIRYP